MLYCTGTHALALSPHLSLSPGYLHMSGTYTRTHPTADATDSHPSAPLLPIRLAFSLPLLRDLLHIHPSPNFFSPPKARHRAVQTPTQQRNSRPKSTHQIKSSCKGERGGKERDGTQLGNLSAASPLLFSQLSFCVLVFFFLS